MAADSTGDASLSARVDPQACQICSRGRRTRIIDADVSDECGMILHRTAAVRNEIGWQTLGQGELLRLIACYSPKPARSVAAKSISMRALFGSWKNNCQTPAACPPPGNRRRSYVRP